MSSTDEDEETTEGASFSIVAFVAFPVKKQKYR